MYAVCCPADGAIPWIQSFDSHDDLVEFLREQYADDPAALIFPFYGRRMFMSTDRRYLVTEDASVRHLNSDVITIDRQDEPDQPSDEVEEGDDADEEVILDDDDDDGFDTDIIPAVSFPVDG